MKILTDFDGTLTDIHGEYEELLNINMERLESRKFPVAQYDTLFKLAIKEIQKDHTKYGWMEHDRITAYSDEDLFMNIIAGIKIVDNWLNTKPEYSALKQILDNHHTSLMEISEESYYILHTKPLGPLNTPLPEVVDTIQKLLRDGHELVVVSNSPSKRIVEKFNYVGLFPAEHDLDPHASFKVRGDAAKFRLGEHPQIHDYVRPVDTNRPIYRKMLLEEKPDVVIGDVFSLDLSLSCALSQELPEFSQTRSLLLNHTYTPEWSKSAILSVKNGFLIDDFNDVTKLK